MPAFNQYGQPTDLSQQPSMYGNRAGRTNNSGQPYGGNGQNPAATNGNDPFAASSTRNFAQPAGRQGLMQPSQGSQGNFWQQTITPPQSGQSGSYEPAGVQMPQGINPQLSALYQKYNVTPGGQGSGFSDWQYWQGKMSAPGADQQYFLNRLEGDLAGNGMDTGPQQMSSAIPGFGNPLSGMNAVQFPNVQYTPGQLPQADFAVYHPGTLTQYQSINQQPTMGLENQVLQNVLNNQSFSPDVVNQMQAALKDQALAMQQGNEGQIRQNYASRGYSGGGGEASDIANQRLGTQSQLLGNYRDISSQAALQNYQDKLAALGQAENVQSGQVNRNIGQWGALNQGQMQQEQLNQLGVQSQNAATQFALQRALEQEGMKQAAAGIGVQTRGQDIQSLLGQGQLGLQQQLGIGGLNLGLGNLGFGYAQLQNQMNQQALQNALQGYNF